MKKLIVLLLALLLVVPTAFAAKTNYLGNAIIDDDVTGFVMTAWNDPFDETHRQSADHRERGRGWRISPARSH